MGIGATNASEVQPAAEDDAAEAPRRARRLTPIPRRMWRSMLDLVLPPLCLACDAPLCDHDALCPKCWRDINFIRPPLCDHLGLPLPFDTGAPMLSAAAVADPPDYDHARAVARFEGPIRHLIHDMKYQDSHNARRLFGRWLTEAGRDLIAEAQILVPIPLSRRRLLFRRFNQAQILAGEVSRLSGIAVAPFALERARNTRSQVGLTRLERKANVAGAFRVSPHGEAIIAGKRVLLIDDVITTGATLSAAAKTLKSRGAARVDALALALVCDSGA